MLTRPTAVRFLLEILVVALLAVAGYAQTPPATSLLVTNRQKVVFLGDSITGLGWSESGSYVHLVTAGLEPLGVKIVPLPAGVGGNTSREILSSVVSHN